MWSYVILFSVMVSFTVEEVMVVEGKVGCRVVLDLGQDVKTWIRRKNDDTMETVEYCPPETGKTGPGCDEFVDMETKQPAFPESKVLIYPNGTLIFKRLRESDGVTMYYSPDSQPHVVTDKDGNLLYAVPPRQIWLALV